jgi:putative transposase
VVNVRLRVTGHLFQTRYGSVVLDEDHLMAAARYVALNPARARLVSRAQDWRCPASARIWTNETTDTSVSRRHSRPVETIGRPLGSPYFLDLLATLTGRDPRPRKRAPKPAANRGLVKCHHR